MRLHIVFVREVCLKGAHKTSHHLGYTQTQTIIMWFSYGSYVVGY